MPKERYAQREHHNHLLLRGGGGKGGLRSGRLYFILTLPGAVRLQAVQGVGRAFRWGLIRVSEESGNREGIQKVSQDRRACTATLVLKAYWELFLNHTCQGPWKPYRLHGQEPGTCV